MIIRRVKAIQRALVVALVVALSPMLSKPVLADDRSYSTIISHIKSSYNARGQSFFGAIGFARFLVKVIRPAGFKDFKMTMLRDVDYSKGPRPDSSDFHTFVRENIHESWQPLVRYSAKKEKQYTYVYFQPEKDDVKILVVVMQQRDAFVLQFKFNPEKLGEFISDPKLLGISLKNDQNGGSGASKPQENSGSDSTKGKVVTANDPAVWNISWLNLCRSGG